MGALFNPIGALNDARKANVAARDAQEAAKAEADRKAKEDADALLAAQNKKKADEKARATAGAKAQASRASQADPNKKQTYGGTIMTSPLGLLGGAQGNQRTLLGA